MYFVVMSATLYLALGIAVAAFAVQSIPKLLDRYPRAWMKTGAVLAALYHMVVFGLGYALSPWSVHFNKGTSPST